MKKKSLKSLSLNKVTIASLNQHNVRGGKLQDSGGIPCTNYTEVEGGCPEDCPEPDTELCWPPAPPMSGGSPHCIVQGTNNGCH